MARVDLQSTSLNAATYQDQRGFLELEFRSGAIYRYIGVPEQVYQELLSAESKGRYFNQHIRNRFIYVQIDPTRSGPTRDSALHKAPGNLLRWWMPIEMVHGDAADEKVRGIRPCHGLRRTSRSERSGVICD